MPWKVSEQDAPEPPDIDVTVAHPARRYDYYPGGKAHSAADREAAGKVLAVLLVAVLHFIRDPEDPERIVTSSPCGLIARAYCAGSRPARGRWNRPY
jgi:hypothetical protein